MVGVLKEGSVAKNAAQVKLTGLGLPEAVHRNGKAVVLHTFAPGRGLWELTVEGEARPVEVKSEHLDVDFVGIALTIATIQCLLRMPHLNGKTAQVVSYNGENDRFQIMCDGNDLELEARYLVGPRGPLRTPFIVKSCDLMDEQKGMFAFQPLNAGEIICEEHPILRFGHEPDFPTASCEHQSELVRSVKMFLALPRHTREKILELHAQSSSDTSNISNDLQRGSAKDNSDQRTIRLLRQLGCNLPREQELEAAHFVRVKRCNAFACGDAEPDAEGSLFLRLSRVNHSCRPNAARLQRGPAAQLVALRSIAEGEEITISYLSRSSLLEPRARRRELLAAWFPRCCCERCAEEEDDARRFRCPRGARCAGECWAAGEEDGGAASVGACRACGARQSERGARGLLEAEREVALELRQLRRARSRSRGGEADAGADLRALQRRCAEAPLAPAHWLAAAASDLAQAECAREGDWRGAVEHGAQWLAALDAVAGLPCLLRAWRRERMGDLYVLQGQFEAGVAAYLEALREMAALRLPAHDPRVGEAMRKARCALRGETSAVEPSMFQ